MCFIAGDENEDTQWKMYSDRKAYLRRTKKCKPVKKISL